LQENVINQFARAAVQRAGGNIANVIPPEYDNLLKQFTIPAKATAISSSPNFIENSATASPDQSIDDEVDELNAMFETNQSRQKPQKTLIIRPPLLPGK
jgi:hypothetical protein